jgi:hypothetical protein
MKLVFKFNPIRHNAQMKKRNLYSPCLNKIEDNWQSRWSALRSITSAWYATEMDLVDASKKPNGYPQVDSYPASVRQWILFREEVQSKIEQSVRDDFVVKNVYDSTSLSLQVISEGNVCWAVLGKHLELEDPPVVCLTGDCHGDYEDGTAFANRWKFGWESNETVTEFALDQIVHMLRGERGGCNVEVQETSVELIEAMEDYFQQSTWFGHTCIFESPDLFATVRDRRLNVEVRGDLALSDLPDCIVRNINHGGAFHGILVP